MKKRVIKPEVEENGNVTTIFFKNRMMTGIKLPYRSGAGPHSTQPKRQRTRASILKSYLEQKDS